MTAWQLIRSHLVADTSVTILALGGIYAIAGKQAEKRPQIVGVQVSGDVPESVDGVQMFALSALDVHCIAHEDYGGGGRGYDAVVDLFEALAVSLRAMRKTTVLAKRIESVKISGVRDEHIPDANWIGLVFSLEIRHQV